MISWDFLQVKDFQVVASEFFQRLKATGPGLPNTDLAKGLELLKKFQVIWLQCNFVFCLQALTERLLTYVNQKHVQLPVYHWHTLHAVLTLLSCNQALAYTLTCFVLVYNELGNVGIRVEPHLTANAGGRRCRESAKGATGSGRKAVWHGHHRLP